MFFGFSTSPAAKVCFIAAASAVFAAPAWAQSPEEMSREEQIFMELIAESQNSQPEGSGDAPTDGSNAMGGANVSIPVGDLPTTDSTDDMAQTPSLNDLQKEFENVRNEFNSLSQPLESEEGRDMSGVVEESAGAPLIDMPTLGAEEQLDTPFAPDLATLQSWGVLEQENGGFPSDIWQGVTFDRAVALLERVQEHGLQSPAGRSLLRKLLLTAADAPVSDDTNKNWLKERVNTLVRLGFLSDAQALLAPLQPKGLETHPDMPELWTKTLLAAGNKQPCPYVKARVLEQSSPFWKRALLTCQVMQDDPGFMLSMALAENTEKASHPTFYKMLESLKNKEIPQVDVHQIDPFVVAIFTAKPDLIFEPELLAALPDTALRAVMDSSVVDGETRILAAESLLNNYQSQSDAAALKGLYQAQTFNLEDLQSAISSSEKMESGALARALLWQAAGAADLASERALLLRTLWQRAEAERLTLLPAAMNPEERNIKPSQNLTWFAAGVVREALRAGNDDLAQKWWPLLARKGRLQHDLAIERADLSIAMGLVDGVVDESMLHAWWKSVEVNTPEDKRQAQKVLALTEAMEHHVPMELWQGLHQSFSDVAMDSGKGPGALWLRVLGTALEQNDMGESLLLLLEPLVYTSAAEMAPQSLANVVSGFHYLGLDDVAWKIAFEGML